MPRIRGNGGFVGKAAVANTIFQRGIWTLAEQELYALAGTWPGIFAYSVQVLYLIVGGGGSSANSFVGRTNASGGGGGGEAITALTTLTHDTYTITVGPGGVFNGSVKDGANSSIVGLGAYLFANGGLASTQASIGRGGISGTGFTGGTTGPAGGSGQAGSGGGGGTAGNGTNGGSSGGTEYNGSGGAGLTSTISGSSVIYGRGGGGGGQSGTGGTAATASTGGGAGGSSSNPVTVQNGQNGAAGIVIISYPTSYGLAIATTGSPTVTTVGANNVYIFTSNGTIQF